MPLTLDQLTKMWATLLRLEAVAREAKDETISTLLRATANCVGKRSDQVNTGGS